MGLRGELTLSNGCPASLGLLVLGRFPGDESKIISVIEEVLAERSCESIRFNGWIFSCCNGSTVKAYATIEQAGLGAALPRVRVSLEGECREVLALAGALAEAARRSGYPTLMDGQEGLIGGGPPLG
ncbi:hypothetical protein [Stetteria hydrogenophila]